MRWLRYAWALPVSLPAWLASCVGGMQRCTVQGVCEAHGGWLGRWMRRATCIEAITLGHVVLGVDRAALARWRAHEHVHVRQYERLGPLMPILYLASSGIATLRGRDAYRANAFEREARVLSRAAECSAGLQPACSAYTAHHDRHRATFRRRRARIARPRIARVDPTTH